MPRPYGKIFTTEDIYNMNQDYADLTIGQLAKKYHAGTDTITSLLDYTVKHIQIRTREKNSRIKLSKNYVLCEHCDGECSGCIEEETCKLSNKNINILRGKY